MWTVAMTHGSHATARSDRGLCAPPLCVCLIGDCTRRHRLCLGDTGTGPKVAPGTEAGRMEGGLTLLAYTYPLKLLELVRQRHCF
jgi:hypothetical protein